MALHAGSHENGGSATLGAAIERAFVGEVFATKGTALPPAGKEDRLILFNAIAQGVVDWLRANEGDLRIVLGGVPRTVTARLAIQAPALFAWTTVDKGRRQLHVVGDRWPAGLVTLVWIDRAIGAGETTASAAGAVSATFDVVPDLTSPQRLAARNAAGDAVVVELTW